jgi:hypothetical protein
LITDHEASHQSDHPKPVWNRLRVLRLQYVRAQYRSRRVRHCYGGHELEVEPVDPMGAGWYDHDWPELHEIALLKQHGLRTGARVFISERTNAWWP